jgi:uncharacterized protein (TIGR03437 family)
MVDYRGTGAGSGATMSSAMRSAILALACAACAHAAPPGAFHLDYATYLGGSLDDLASAIAVDSSGNTYIAGETDSPDFPITNKAFTVPYAVQGCVFVAKLNANASGIVWSVCLPAVDANAIAVDGNGGVYLLTDGTTVTQLTPAGSKIAYSKKLNASLTSIAVDPAGDVYAAGSAPAGFATTPGAFQPDFKSQACPIGPPIDQPPCANAVAIKLDPSGAIAYATYLGASGIDQANAVAVDSQGNAWLTGSTTSPDFPLSSNAFQTTFRGVNFSGPLRFGDAFVSELDRAGAKLLYSTYLGGQAPDAGFAIAIDTADSAYVAGATQSTNFPTTPNAFQLAYLGATAVPSYLGDGFVAKFSASGALIYSTYLGGPQSPPPTVLQADAAGRAYVSIAPTTPTIPHPTLSILNADGASLANTLAVPRLFTLDPHGAIYFANTTETSLFSPTAGALQTSFGGGTYDAAIVKAELTGVPSPWVSTIVNAASMQTGTPSFYPVYDVAPGELILIAGSGFDSETRVAIAGIPAPVLSIGPNLIEATVPFEASGAQAAITVDSPGEPRTPAIMNLYPAVPGIFTADGSGAGQAAALNEDGTPNSPLNPAARGSVVSLFLTGAGQMTPAQPDGSKNPLFPPLPNPVLGVGCNLGPVLFAGAAPGLAAGVLQVNVRISENTPLSNSVPLYIYVGDYVSQYLPSSVTVAVK